MRQLTGHDGAVLGHDEGVVGAALGDEAVFDQPSVVGAFFMGFLLGQGGGQQLQGLDVAAMPADIRQGHDGQALLGGRVVKDVLFLGEHDQRRCRVLGKIEIPVGGAARDL